MALESSSHEFGWAQFAIILVSLTPTALHSHFTFLHFCIVILTFNPINILYSLR